jgi:hypothetical protein
MQHVEFIDDTGGGKGKREKKNKREKNPRSIVGGHDSGDTPAPLSAFGGGQEMRLRR